MTIRIRPQLWLWLGVLLSIGAAIRLWFAFYDWGVYYPDELYQTLEAGHRLAFGYGMKTWEYVQGLRNWTLPALLGGVMWLVNAAGFDHPLSYLSVLRVLFILLQLVGIASLYQFVRSRGGQPPSGILAIFVATLSAPLIYFSYRSLSEAVAAPLLVIGWMLATGTAKREARSEKREEQPFSLDSLVATHRSLILGVSLVALATVIRLPLGVFPALLLIRSLVRREWVATGLIAATLGVWWLILLGLVDQLTWGRWFHSVVEYVQYNLIEGKASNFGTAPTDYYLTTFQQFTGPLSIALIGFAIVGWWRAPWFSLALVSYVAIHTAIPHKEFRFLIPAVLGLMPVAALGLDTLWQRWRPVGIFGATLLVGLSLLSVYRLPALTRATIGFPPFGDSAFNTNADVNRLLVVAHDLPDLCGLNVDQDLASVWSGGFTYLHRDLPLYWAHPWERQYWNEGKPRFYNYEIRHIGVGHPGTMTATHGTFELVHLTTEPCVPDIEYTRTF